jgi:hypothetical protein
VRDPGSQALNDAATLITQAARILAQKVPQAQAEVRAIMEAVQSIQAKISGNQAPVEAQAPPL